MTLIKTGKFELTRKKPNNLKRTQYENFEHELFRKFSSPKIFTRKKDKINTISKISNDPPMSLN